MQVEMTKISKIYGKDFKAILKMHTTVGNALGGPKSLAKDVWRMAASYCIKDNTRLARSIKLRKVSGSHGSVLSDEVCKLNWEEDTTQYKPIKYHTISFFWKQDAVKGKGV